MEPRSVIDARIPPPANALARRLATPPRDARRDPRALDGRSARARRFDSRVRARVPRCAREAGGSDARRRIALFSYRGRPSLAGGATVRGRLSKGTFRGLDDHRSPQRHARDESLGSTRRSSHRARAPASSRRRRHGPARAVLRQQRPRRRRRRRRGDDVRLQIGERGPGRRRRGEGDDDGRPGEGHRRRDERGVADDRCVRSGRLAPPRRAAARARARPPSRAPPDRAGTLLRLIFHSFDSPPLSSLTIH